jgi:hypothetical protein
MTNEQKRRFFAEFTLNKACPECNRRVNVLAMARNVSGSSVAATKNYSVKEIVLSSLEEFTEEIIERFTI